MEHGSGSTSEGSSIYSSSSFEKKKHVYVRHKFTSYTMYMVALFGIQLCISDLIIFAAMALKYKGVTFLIPFLVAQIFVAVPVCMGQILLGQYGMVGQIHVWRITPLMYGMGISMLFTCLLYSKASSLVAAYSGLYIVNACQAVLPWNDCNFERADPTICESRGHVHGSEYITNLNTSFHSPFEDRHAEPMPGLDKRSQQDSPRVMNIKYAKEKQSPSFHYFSKHMQPQLRKNEEYPLQFGKFQWKTYLVWTVVWVSATVFVFLGFARIIKVLIVAYALCCISILFVIFLEFHECDIPHGLRKVFTMNIDQMVRMEYWMDVLSLGITNLALATGAMILYGSYLTAKWRPDTTALLIAVVKTLASLFFASVIIVLYGKEELRYPPEHYTIAGEGMSSFFFPVVTSFMTRSFASHIFILIFLLCIVFYGAISTALYVSVITECLADTFVKARHYRKYITISVCGCCCVFGAFNVTDVGEQLERCLTNSIKGINLIIGVMFSLFTFLVYGSQKLADDMEFITQVRLPKVWRIMWIVSVLPFLGVSCFLGQVIQEDKFHKILYIYNISEICVLLSPIAITAIVVYFKYLKNRALLALIRPSNDWGPQDQKKKRKIFNPRKSVKYKNPSYTCNHNCLVGSFALKHEIERLDAQRKLFMEMPRNKEENNVSSEL